MTQLTIVTTPTNSGDGTPLATAFNFCNSNFSELYSRVQTTPPTTFVGQVGDTAGMYAYDDTFFYYCFANFDGVSTIWGEIAQAGNIAVSAINSGSSNVKIADLSGNATTSIAGTANVIVVATTGQFVTGVVSATGNVTGNFILGNGSQLSGLPQTYANANVVALLATFGSNTVSTTGNISTGNINTVNQISATGNITTAGFFVGDFSGNIVGTLTNIPGPGGAVVFNNGSGNAAATAGLVFDNSGPNVLTVDGAFSATGGVTATGNITGGNVLAAGITGTLATAAQPNITSVGALTSVSVVANVQGGNLRTAGQVSATGNIRTSAFLVVTQDINAGGDVTATSFTGTTASLAGNVTGGNLRTAGQISATGNITGNFFLGNGSQLTGLITNTIQNGNSNVLIGSSGGNVSINVSGTSPVVIVTPLGQTVAGQLSATGTVTGGNLVTTGSASVTGTINASGNIIGANVTSIDSVSATGNVQAGNVRTTGQISATGNITGSALNVNAGNITAGNLSVSAGTITVGNIVNGAGNGIGNIGTSTIVFNTVFAKATSAQYADLAENYVSDAHYDAGTVVVFAGSQEITICMDAADERVAGVISTNPAHLMNAGQPGLPVALRGRVPVKVVGSVVKGDSLVTSSTPGHAHSVGRVRSYGQAVFAKAVETNDNPGEKIIQAVIL
jgi:hypothetical protein